jgi:hypothetical protein
MRNHQSQISYLIPILSILLATTSVADKTKLDNNSAFYEGATYNYVMPSPPGYQMFVEEAGWEGYSFAFVPEKEKYATASVHIAVTIYKQTDITLAALLKRDTVQIRRDYGKNVVIRAVDPVKTSSGEIVKMFYVDDKSRFIPTVILAYLDGRTEFAAYQLSIAKDTPRFEAEIAFDETIRRTKLLERASFSETKK